MKIVVKIFVVLVSVVLFTACSTYQQVKLKSDSPQNEKSEFLAGNDLINIVYSFNGKGGPIYMELYNQLDVPLSVDWRKSALIVDGRSFSLWKDEAKLSATSTQFQTMPEDELLGSSGSLDGTLVKNDKISFIPPHSKIVFNSYVLKDQFFNSPQMNGERIIIATLKGSTNATKFSFTKEDSPLKFRIFLSVSVDGSSNPPIRVDNSFWVSDYFNTPASPKAWSLSKGDQFYNQKKSSTGKTIGFISLVGILAATALLVDMPGH